MHDSGKPDQRNVLGVTCENIDGYCSKLTHLIGNTSRHVPHLNHYTNTPLSKIITDEQHVYLKCTNGRTQASFRASKVRQT